MSLVRLIYCSRSRCGSGDLQRILESATRNNRRQHLSGLLFFGDEQFLQVLEGHTAHVNRLYETLLHDDRHEDVNLVEFSPIESRRFAGWSMGHCGEQSLATERIGEDVIFRYSTDERFDGYGLAPAAALEFLVEASRASQRRDRRVGEGRPGAARSA